MNGKSFLLLSFLLIQNWSLQAQTVLALNPLYTEQQALLLPQAESRWAFDENDTVVIQKTGDNFYRLQYGKANNPSPYEAVFFSLGNTTLLDLVPKISDTTGSKDYRKQVQCLHSFLKIKIEKDTLWVAELSYAWLYHHLQTNSNLLAHSWIEGGFLITASSQELRNFVEAHLQDLAFFDQPFPLARVKMTPATTKSSKSVAKHPTMAPLMHSKQNCPPAFPLKAGWLGGDGDVSLPVNDRQSLFLFSDTYVGQKTDTSRKSKSYTMVSNTVGLATCRPDGGYEIHYYWKSMYSDQPKPIFESHTNRYRYWINDAFMHKGSLYVLMPKIGAKTAPTPGDDIFNFSIVGASMAKVTDPMGQTPDKWTPDLLPFTFLDPAQFDLHSLAKDSHYLYLFTDKGLNQTVLLRIPLDFIESPEEHIEYYSTSQSWKAGIDTADMMVTLPERPGNTINYHDDIKKWVMVCGPGFLDNKIRLRTASRLTGPWSESVTVYECPEVIPGTPEYNKTNFCYLGRELIQHYDRTTRTMFITYDTNNADFSAIKSNPGIYTPKIITIPLSRYGIR